MQEAQKVIQRTIESQESSQGTLRGVRQNSNRILDSISRIDGAETTTSKKLLPTFPTQRTAIPYEEPTATEPSVWNRDYLNEASEVSARDDHIIETISPQKRQTTLDRSSIHNSAMSQASQALLKKTENLLKSNKSIEASSFDKQSNNRKYCINKLFRNRAVKEPKSRQTEELKVATEPYEI